MKLYHGTSNQFTVDDNRYLYLTSDIKVAKLYALGLDSEGNYNEESFIYELEIDESIVVAEDDFEYFDSMGYLDYANMPEVVYNAESEYYCVKHPAGLRLIENYKNSL